MRRRQARGYSNQYSGFYLLLWTGFTRKISVILMACLMGGLVACNPEKMVASNADSGVITHDMAATTPPHNRTGSGFFLAARQALYFNDIGQSATFFLETLKNDPDNIELLQQTFLAQYFRGDIVKATALGRQMEGLNISGAFRAEPATALAILSQDWPAVLVLADNIGEDSSSLGLSSIIKAWALIASDQGDAGITHLKGRSGPSTEQSKTTPPYVVLHTALMAEYLNRPDEVVQQIMAVLDAPMPPLTALHIAALLARNGGVDHAHKLIDTRLGPSFDKTHIKTILAIPSKNMPPSILQNIAHGIVDFSLMAEQSSQSQILKARLQLAHFIDKDSDATRLLLGQQQIEFGLSDAAAKSLIGIQTGGYLGQPALIALSDIANDQQYNDEAAALLREAIDLNPNDGYLHKLLGDCYRRWGEYAKGRDAYQGALDRGYVTSDLHRNLGVTLERLGDFERAEAHLRTALKMNPNDAYALNYLGYWWADLGRNLDEAIALIEKAVKLRPDSGFFVDSLGWVHFQLGDPYTAVEYLERATELEPSDAEIIGHLGDVYWHLGRFSEARFKWRLALSLSRDDAEKTKFQDRIKHGLDAVDTSGVQS